MLKGKQQLGHIKLIYYVFYIFLDVLTFSLSLSCATGTSAWQNGGFSAKLNIWFSNEH